MPQTIVVAKGGRSNAAATLDHELDWGAALGLDNGLLQLVCGVRASIDRNELGACSDVRIEGRAFPKYLSDSSIGADVQADGK